MNTLKVTTVNVYPYKCVPEHSIKALVDIVLEEQLMIRGLRLMWSNDTKTFYVAYPPDLFYKGEDYKSQVFPITKQLRDEIETVIVAKYKVTMELDNDSKEN